MTIRQLQLPRVPPVPSFYTGEQLAWGRLVTDALNSAQSYFRIAGSSVASVQIRGNPVCEISGTDPKLFTYNSLGATDEKAWDHVWGTNTGSGGILFRARNDADNNGNTWLSVQRSGITITSVTFARLATSGSTINIAEAGAQGALAGNAAGTAGDIAWGSSSNVSYLYVCVSTNSWMRAALSPF